MYRVFRRINSRKTSLVVWKNIRACVRARARTRVCVCACVAPCDLGPSRIFTKLTLGIWRNYSGGPGTKFSFSRWMAVCGEQNIKKTLKTPKDLGPFFIWFFTIDSILFYLLPSIFQRTHKRTCVCQATRLLHAGQKLLKNLGAYCIAFVLHKTATCLYNNNVMFIIRPV